MPPPFPPNLSDPARDLLRILLSFKIARGGDLMQRTQIFDSAQILEPIKELLNQGLIEVSGELSPDFLPFATFSIVPSALEYSRAIVQRR
jgi:hypothetical protein